MATTVNIVNREVPGAAYMSLVEIGFSANNDYVTNGIPITAATLGLQRLDFFIPMILGPSLSAGISDLSWDKANSKIKLYTSGAVELNNGTDISTMKIYALVKGV